MTLPRPWEEIRGPAGAMAVYVAEGKGDRPRTLVVCHGFPTEPGAAARTARTFPALADQLSQGSGWSVVTGCFRGAGPSEGDFSIEGWIEDIDFLLDYAISLSATRDVSVVGFGTGGSLALCVGARNRRVRAVACLGSPASLAAWGEDVGSMLEAARAAGAIRSPGFPPDLEAWGRMFFEFRPDQCAAKFSPRPILVVQGADDDVVAVSEARALVDAAGASAELKILPGAGHGLRSDPRAIAIVLGWLERQGP